MIFEVSGTRLDKEKCREEMKEGNWCEICSNDCPYAWQPAKERDD